MFCAVFCGSSRKRGADRDPSVPGKLIERALALDPAHVGALCLQGLWHFKAMGDVQQGFACLEVLERLPPDPPFTSLPLNYL